MLIQLMETVQNLIRVAPSTKNLADLRKDLYSIAQENDIPVPLTRRMVIAIDEAVSNVIEHGEPSDTQEIEVTIGFTSDCITATITDHGIAFDPSNARTTVETRKFPKRGFGLYLIRLIVDSIEYERTSCGKNVLTLKKAVL